VRASRSRPPRGGTIHGAAGNLGAASTLWGASPRFPTDSWRACWRREASPKRERQRGPRKTGGHQSPPFRGVQGVRAVAYRLCSRVGPGPLSRW
jgi:hypothetical protein